VVDQQAAMSTLMQQTAVVAYDEKLAATLKLFVDALVSGPEVPDDVVSALENALVEARPSVHLKSRRAEDALAASLEQYLATFFRTGRLPTKRVAEIAYTLSYFVENGTFKEGWAAFVKAVRAGVSLKEEVLS